MNLFEWLFSEKQELDWKTFDLDVYEKRLKPTNTFAGWGLTEPGYVPQIKIKGVWKTFCRHSIYRSGRRGSKTLYFFLMPEDNIWCCELSNFGKDNKKAVTKDEAEGFFLMYDRFKTTKLQQYIELSKLKPIYL